MENQLVGSGGGRVREGGRKKSEMTLWGTEYTRREKCSVVKK